MANTSLDIKIKAVVEGLEKFQQTRDALDKIISELENFEQPSTKARKSVKALADEAGLAVDDLGDLEKQSLVLQEALEGITGAESLEEIRGRATDALASLTELGGGVNSLDRLVEGADGVTEEMLQMQREVRTLTDVLDDLSRVDSIEDLEQVAKDSAQALEMLGHNAESADRDASDLSNALRETSNSASATAKNLKDAARSTDNAGESFREGAADVGAMESEVDRLTGELLSVDDAADQAADSISDIGDSSSQAQGSSTALGGAISQLQSWFGQARDSSSGFLTSLREVTNVGPTVGGVVGGLVGVFSKFKEQIGLVVSGIVAFAAVSNLKESADLAARVESLGVTMEVVGKNAGYTKDQLSQYEEEVKGLGITSQAARETITQMASAGLELGNVSEGTSSQVAQLARASQDLAVRMGGSSSETLQQMITNIQQLDTEGLRYMGIILDVGKAQEKYATQLGTTTGALTQAQKQQAVLNEVLEQSRAQTGLYEASMETVAKQIGSLSRYKEELAQSIGEKLLPAYGALVKNTTEYMKDLKGIAENTDEAGTAANNWATAMDGLSDLIFTSMKGVAKIFSEANQGMSVLGATIGDLLSAFANLFSSFQEAETGVLTIGKVIGGFATAVAGLIALLQDGAVVLVASFGAIGSSILHMVGVVIESLGKLLFFIPGVGSELQKLGKSWREMGREGYDASMGVIDGVLQGEGAVGKFNDRILETNALMEKAAKNGAFDTIEEEIVKLLEAQRKNTMQSHEMAKASDDVAEAMKRLAAEGKLTEKEVGILGAKLAAVGNKDLAAFNDALALIGVSAQELREGTTASFGEVVGGLKELAQNANTTSDIFHSAFSRSIDGAETINDIYALNEALVSYQQRLEKTGELSEEEMAHIREQAQLLKEKFEEVFKEGLDTAKTSKEFQRLKDDTERMGKAMIEAGVMTEEGLKNKLDQIADAATKAGKSLEFGDTIKALDEMGMSFDELTTGVSENADKIVRSLDDILAAGQLTSGQLREVFNNAIDQAKTLDDLAVIKQRITEAFESGKMSASDFNSAVTDLGAKFVQVFQNDLSTVTTKQELDALRAKVVAMGAEGEISGKQVAYALQEINKKAQEGKQSMLELAQNATNLANAQVRAVQAQNNEYKAMLNVLRAANALDEARNQYAEDGTDLSREMVRLREQELAIAQQQHRLAQMNAELEQNNIAVLIAQQAVLRAEKEATMASDAAAAQMAIERANKNLEAEQLKGEAILQNIASQQIALSNLEAQKAKTEEIVATLQKAAKASEEVGEKAQESAKSTGSLGDAIGKMIDNNTARTTRLLREAGFEEDEVRKKAEANRMEFVKGLRDMLSGANIIGQMRWDRMEAQLQAQIAYKKHALELEEREKKNLAEKEQRWNDLVSNAERLAELGYDANTSWKALADEGLTQGANLMSRMKATAKETIKAAQDSVMSFMSSINSIKEEYLEATGQEDLALAMRYQQRKRELELEYEMLRVKVTAAKIVAKQAGESTAVLDKALAEAEAGYKQSLKYLEEMEKMEQEKLKKQKEEEAAAAKKKAEEEAKTKQEAETKATQEAALTRAFEAALAKTLATDPDHDGKDAKGQPLHFTFEVGGKKIEATTDSTKEELLDVLETLNKRS